MRLRTLIALFGLALVTLFALFTLIALVNPALLVFA